MLKKTHKTKYWNKKLDAKFKEVEVANKIFTETRKTEDYRLLKNRKNTLKRETKEQEKIYNERKLNTNLGK